MMETEIALKRYLKDVGACHSMTPAKEQELAKIIHGKNSSKASKLRAREELIVGNLTLVIRIALDIYDKYHFFDEMNCSLMDLVQMGNIGLMRAADCYRPGRNTKFVTYAYLTVERHIKRGIKHTRFIRLPDQSYSRLYRMDKLISQHGKLNDEKLAKKLHVKMETLKALQSSKAVMFYDKFKHYDIDSDNNDNPIENYKDTSASTVDILHSSDLKRYVFEKIKELRPRYRDVLFYKFFSNQEMSGAIISKKMGISREAVRIFLNKALHGLKQKIDYDFIKTKYAKGKEKHENT